MGKKKVDDLKEIALRTPAKDMPFTEIETTEKLDDFISKIADIGRKILRLETVRDKEIAGIKTRYQKKTDPLKSLVNIFFEAVMNFALKHRDELLPPDRKSLEFTNGTIGWQLNQPSVKLIVDEETAVDFLKKQGHRECVRIKETVDLEALGKNPELARSLSIVEYAEGIEHFFVKPQGVQVEFTRRMKALSQKVTAVKKKRVSRKKLE